MGAGVLEREDMMRNVVALAMVLTICAVTVPIARPLQKETHVTAPLRLNPKIPRADRKKYLSLRAIRDPKGWPNPALIIRADGIEVIAKGIGRTLIAPGDLRRTLIDLPLYRQAAESVLKELKIEINWVPSA